MIPFALPRLSFRAWAEARRTPCRSRDPDLRSWIGALGNAVAATPCWRTCPMGHLRSGCSSRDPARAANSETRKLKSAPFRQSRWYGLRDWQVRRGSWHHRRVAWLGAVLAPWPRQPSTLGNRLCSINCRLHDLTFGSWDATRAALVGLVGSDSKRPSGAR